MGWDTCSSVLWKKDNIDKYLDVSIIYKEHVHTMVSTILITVLNGNKLINLHRELLQKDIGSLAHQ